MPGVFGGEAFVEEYVTQVGAAIGADDFRAHAVGIGNTFYRAFDLVVEAGPAAMGTEFIFRAIQGGVAAFAGVSSFFFIIQPFTGIGPFSAFMQDHLCFFGR